MTWRRRASAVGADLAVISAIHGVGRRFERTASTASATKDRPVADRSSEPFQAASTCWRKLGIAAVPISAWAGTLPVDASTTGRGSAAQCPQSGSITEMTATKAKRRSVTSRITRAYRSAGPLRHAAAGLSFVILGDRGQGPMGALAPL